MALIRRGARSDHQYRHVTTLEPPPGFDDLRAVSVGPDGNAVALWENGQDRFALTEHLPGAGLPARTTYVEELRVEWPFVQALPNGDFVVANARCAWQESGPEQNAWLVGADGSIRRRGTIGDGIEHLLADADGNLWVGYFDEGIFGNLGWGHPGPTPLGAPGIVRWSTDFEIQWQYEGVDRYWLANCYTLNVAHDQVWSCPYADFPVVRIVGQDVQVLPTDATRGPQGIVVASDVVGIVGDYDGGGWLLTGPLERLPQLSRSVIGMPDGSAPPRGHLVCRGSVAHLFVDRDWFAFDLAAVVT